MKKKSKQSLDGLGGISAGAIVGLVALAAVAGLGYYYFVAIPAPGSAPALPAPGSSAGGNTSAITVDYLKSRSWNGPRGLVNSTVINGYNAATGVVTQNDSHWTGKLIDINTIHWTKNTGEQQDWKAI